MRWITPIGTAIMLLPAGLVTWLLWRLRRAGRPDRAGEWVVGFWAVGALTRAALMVMYPGSVWLPGIILFLMLAVCFGFMISRMRQYPEVAGALISPAARARFQAIRARIRRRSL